AQRYATLPVPCPTPEETSRLIARLQASANHEPSPLSVSPRRRVIPLLEVLAAVLLVGALVSSFLLVLASRLHHPTAPSAAITGRPVTLQTLRMFDAANGWATTFDGVTMYGSRHVLHTSKGMLHWQDVSPKRVAQSNDQGMVEAADFMNASTAWVVFDPHPISSGPTPHPLFVERTTDGGKTWQETTLVPQAPASIQQISFLTPQDGWLLLIEGAAAGSEGVEVLRTTDGGATWRTMTRTTITTPTLPGALPFGGDKLGISFINQNTGWIPDPLMGIYQTQDSGATWYLQHLPPPGTLPPTTPTHLAGAFPLLTFNGREEIFPAVLELPDGRAILELYRTLDGGHTWQAVSTLSIPSAELDAITFLDPENGWAAGVQKNTLLLSATSDGGNTWKSFSQALPPDVFQISELNFVTKMTGWMIGVTNEERSTRVFQTTNGGQTWREVQPRLEVVTHPPEANQ
ncbi:MAG: hypothetical protein JOZ18_19110, partial [Chloroflexi bacterium]|nr:hypothetical protein [Chloroflexota bacterium]